MSIENILTKRFPTKELINSISTDIEAMSITNFSGILEF